MTSMEKQLKCFYLDSELQPASDMLRQCVGDNTSPYRFNCEEDPMKQVLPEDVKETARMNDIAIQRGFASYNVNNFNNENNKPSVKKEIQNITNITNNKEGYTNYRNPFVTDNGLGESQISRGECPEGYSKCPITGKCIQKCIGCVYRDNMKSREFNEADPCFPNGVYNGITNDGYIKCTCGRDNKYCDDNFIKNIFTADGMMMNGQKIIMNTGLTKNISDLFNFNYL
jgi:hypothetical protein